LWKEAIATNDAQLFKPKNMKIVKLMTFMAIQLIFVITLVCLLFSPASAQNASSMGVANAGFETGDLTGWSTVASGGYGSGAAVINNVTNQSVQYPNFANPLPGTASGSYYGLSTTSTYYASLRGYTGNPAEVLYQDVTANGQGNPPLQPNTTYTLTVAVGVGKYEHQQRVHCAGQRNQSLRDRPGHGEHEHPQLQQLRRDLPRPDGDLHDRQHRLGRPDHRDRDHLRVHLLQCDLSR
jgi:hypothetical protein